LVHPFSEIKSLIVFELRIVLTDGCPRGIYIGVSDIIRMVNEFSKNGTVQRIVKEMNDTVKFQKHALERRIAKLNHDGEEELSVNIRKILNEDVSIVS
jgi:hypothetical protein